VEAYNKANRWTKKGISVTTSRWTMNSPAAQWQVGAHLTVYSDGTVSVCTGGCEIGQGLNTKVAMAAAQALGIPLESVAIGDGDTKVLPNNGITGGSGTSESCAQATLDACGKLQDILRPFVADGDNWTTLVGKALAAGANLVATGFNTAPWDKSDPAVNVSSYIVYGACVSEVLLDVLTGETRVEKVDVLMDLGSQLNAAVDLGQVQGGFIMALGYLFTEEQKWAESGRLLNLGTWEYKVPTAYDIPVEFNVSLLKDTPNPNGVKGCKACAEPAMHLVSAPYLATKQAMYAARKELGHGDDWFPLSVPCTPETIRAAIGTQRLVLP